MGFVAGVVLAACLPPDFDIAPVVNEPLSIDRSQIDQSIDPDQVITLDTCSAFSVELRPGSAIQNPDDDFVFSYWFVDFTPGSTTEFARSSSIDNRRPYAEPFVVSPCALNLSQGVTTVRLVVRDRNIGELEDETPLAVMSTEEEPDVTIAFVTWFIDVVADPIVCCE